MKTLGFKQLLVTLVIILGATVMISAAGYGLWVTGIVAPDATVSHGDTLVASSVCGIMYVVDDKATVADFKLLLQRTMCACDDAPGTEEDYRNSDGSLKHTVILGNAETIVRPGTAYDSCIINWELSATAATKAFTDVCLNRKF